MRPLFGLGTLVPRIGAWGFLRTEPREALRSICAHPLGVLGRASWTHSRRIELDFSRFS